MSRVFRAPRAFLDLESIWLHIAYDDPAAAGKLLDRIDQVCLRLADYPFLGRERPELAPGLRSFTIGNYLVYYRPIEGGIEVARVLASQMDLGPSLF